MADLLSALSMAARALEAQRHGLEVTGQNIANVNTPGYTRRVADLRAVPPTDVGNAGGGVEVAGVRAVRDLLLERRLRAEQSIEQRHSALADVLAQVETVVGLPGESVDADMERFFDAYARLAEDPTSTLLRQQVIEEGRAVAEAFRTATQRLNDIRRSADDNVRAEVEAINRLTTRIATLNQSMSGADQEPQQKRDETLEAIKELSEHLDIVVLEQPNGWAFDIYSLRGQSLVTDGTAYAVSAVSTGPSGFADVVYDGATVTGDLVSGRIAGYVQARDTLIPDYTNRHDELAYSFVQQVNALHDPGYDLNGVDAGNFFTPLAAQAGASAAIAVDSTLAADPARVAAAGVSAPGDNQVARTMASLRDQLVVDSNTVTFNDFWADLAFRVGRDAEAATSELESRGDTVRQIEALRDAVSSVSLSEEALQLTRFQRAYEANARLFRTIDETIDMLMSMVGA